MRTMPRSSAQFTNPANRLSPAATQQLVSRLVFAATLLASLLFLFGCTDGKSDAVALRVAAFTYAFEHDTETKNDPGKWIFTIESDFGQNEVAQALSSYPLARGAVTVEDRGSSARVDTKSGKRFAHWSVNIEKKSTGEVWAEVGCVKGGLNGYGQMLFLKKKSGRWAVVSSAPSWVS